LKKNKQVNEFVEAEPIKYSSNLLEEYAEGSRMLKEEIEKSKEYRAFLLEKQILSEKVIEGNVPVRKFSYDTKNALIVPEFSARQKLAYGTVEYDRRDIKDRRYNQPLIMTIRFKERLSSDTYSDNELTAVIGILGVVTRIPSNEMKYILKTNAEGDTLKGILKTLNPLKNTVDEIFSSTKIKKNVENLPQSLDV